MLSSDNPATTGVHFFVFFIDRLTWEDQFPRGLSPPGFHVAVSVLCLVGFEFLEPFLKCARSIITNPMSSRRLKLFSDNPVTTGTWLFFIDCLTWEHNLPRGLSSPAFVSTSQCPCFAFQASSSSKRSSNVEDPLITFFSCGSQPFVPPIKAADAAVSLVQSASSSEK